MEEKIIYTAGTWDLFHIGHLNLIQRAHQLGTKLIVGVSTDALVKTYKEHLPLIPYTERYAIIESLRIVDTVVEQRVLLDPTQFLQLNIDVLVLGDDWEDSEHPGIVWMKKHREMVFLPRTPSISTSAIKKTIHSSMKFG